MSDSVRAPDDSSLIHGSRDAAPSAGRRALLVAMPTIVSLHPGLAAAHARSSSQLVLTDFEPVDDVVYCVKKPWGATKSGKGWDIGDKGWLEATKLSPNNNYYRYVGKDRKTGKPKYKSVSRQAMCQEGGDYYYKPKSDGKYGYASVDDGLDIFGTDSTLDSLDSEDENGLLAQGGDGSLETTGYGGGDGKEGGHKMSKVQVPKGGMVSATALASFAGRCKITASV